MICCVCNGSCCHVGPHSYCAEHGAASAPSYPGVPWPVPDVWRTWPTGCREHCYCQDASYPDEHAQCCKCLDRRARALIASSTPVVTIRPGDTLVIRSPSALSPAAIEHIRAGCRQQYPDVKVMVLEGGLELSVLHAEAEAPA